MALEELQLLLEKRAKYASQISEVRMEIAMAEFRKESKSEAEATDALVEVELNKDNLVSHSTQKIYALNEMLSEAMQKTKNPASKRIQEIQRGIQRAEEALADRKSVLRPQLMEVQASAKGTHRSLPELEKQKQWWEDGYAETEKEIEEHGEVYPEPG